MAINDLRAMGHEVVQIEAIDMYLKKNGIFNINVINHIQNNNAQIQNLINNPDNKIQEIGTLHKQIYNIIRQNNLFNNYIDNKNTIIKKILSENKNLKKQRPNTINNYKKKITDAINSKQLENLVALEIK